MLAAPASLACKERVHFAHASNNRAAGTTGIPRAMVLRLIRGLLGVPGFLAAVACRFVTRKLDPSVGGSGPHDFALRVQRFVVARFASIASRLGSGDVRPKRPSCRAGAWKHRPDCAF